VILEAALAVGNHDEIELPKPQALQCGIAVEHAGADKTAARRTLDHRDDVGGPWPLHYGDRLGVGRLVAECDAEAERQQQRKRKDPEDHLGLALEFFHASHE